VDNRIGPPDGDWIAQYLLESMEWISAEMLGGRGSFPAVTLNHGLVARTHHLPSRGPRDERCEVDVEPGSNPHQYRHQAGHEALHVVVGRDVYHWTQEAAACLATQRLHERFAVADNTIAGWEYVELYATDAEQATEEDKATFIRAAVPPAAGVDRNWFYRCALALGLQLESIVGPQGVGQLATEVAAVANGCNQLSHKSHEACVMDSAAARWVGGLSQEQAVDVRQVLGLADSL
jgi:hypothetical protein